MHPASCTNIHHDVTDLVNLLNYKVHQPANDFLDYLAYNSITPYILQLTKLASNSKTLIGYIFSKILL